MDPTLIIGQLLILLFSVILHEVAHGYVAHQRGDDTALRAGRLTLNPLAHIDLFGTIILPLLLAISGLPIIGWAKPVPVHPSAMDHPRQDWMMVSLAGPFTNLLLAALAAIPLRFGLVSTERPIVLLLMVVTVNVTLAIFNLIPVPPLDGSRMVMRFLPERALRAYMRLEGYTGMMILYVLLALGLISRVLRPIVEYLVTALIGF